jgi:colanic acid/amylovoran biosynthesis glycosyltransferase
MRLPDSDLVYLLDHYPVVSQTFVNSEIRGVRNRGVRVTVVALRSGSSSAMSDASADIVLSDHLIAAFFAHLLCLARNPLGYIRYVRTWSIAGRASFVWCAFAPLLAQVLPVPTPPVHTHFGLRSASVGRCAQDLRRFARSVTWHAIDIFQEPAAVQLKADRARSFTISRYNAWYMQARWGIVVDRVIHCGIERGHQGVRAKPADVVLLSVGRLVEKKGHDDLIDAMAILRDRDVSATLTIVGDGPMRASLDRQVSALGLSRQVRLVGAVPVKDILPLMDCADMFVLACKEAANGDRDGIPVSIMEAMTNRLPVVTTAMPGFDELLTERTAWLAQPGDADSLATTIIDAVNDWNAVVRRAEFAKAMVDDTFSVERQCDEILAALGIVPHRRRPNARGRSRE